MQPTVCACAYRIAVLLWRVYLDCSKQGKLFGNPSQCACVNGMHQLGLISKAFHFYISFWNWIPTTTFSINQSWYFFVKLVLIQKINLICQKINFFVLFWAAFSGKTRRSMKLTHSLIFLSLTLSRSLSLVLSLSLSLSLFPVDQSLIKYISFFSNVSLSPSDSLFDSLLFSFSLSLSLSVYVCIALYLLSFSLSFLYLSLLYFTLFFRFLSNTRTHTHTQTLYLSLSSFLFLLRVQPFLSLRLCVRELFYFVLTRNRICFRSRSHQRER